MRKLGDLLIAFEQKKRSVVFTFREDFGFTNDLHLSDKFVVVISHNFVLHQWQERQLNVKNESG